VAVNLVESGMEIIREIINSPRLTLVDLVITDSKLYCFYHVIEVMGTSVLQVDSDESGSDSDSDADDSSDDGESDSE